MLALMISIIPIIAGIMFLYRFKSSILNVLRKLKKDEKNTQNYIAIFGLVSPVIVYVATLFLPFIITIPLLDYKVSETYSNDNKLKVSLSNFGMISAKNVIVSVNANKTDVEFNNFTTQPLLSKSIDNLTSQTGNAFFKIDVIPPTSGTVITADLKNLDNKTKITTSIRSDVWVAYHNLIPILVIYPSVLIGLSLLLIRMVKPIFEVII